MTTKRYLITVITGTKRFADSRAEVNMTIQGTLGSSPETQLKGEFETGSSREFDFEFPDLGSLTSIDLRHDNAGTAPAWFVDKVVVKDTSTGSTWVFPAGQWLSDTATHTFTGELLGSDEVVTPTLWRGLVWGQNDHGELGDGTNKRRFAPSPMPYLDQVGVSAIDGGGWFGLALLNDGSVWGWGRNDWAQLGDGTKETRHAPVDVMHLARFGVKAIAAGGWFSAALLKDGTVWTWGANDWRQLGAGDTGFNSHTIPVKVEGLSGVTAVDVGGWHSLALREDGTVWSWGHGHQGQLGDGTNADHRLPAEVPGLSGVKAVSAGYRHSLALLKDGTVWSWGYNAQGQLGDGTNTNRNTPVKVASLGGRVKAVAASSSNVFHDPSFSLALLEDGTVWSWGTNDWHQLGDGTNTSRNTPVKVSDLSGVKAIAPGGRHSLALLKDGTVWGWGANDHGQVGTGDGTPNRYAAPVKIESLSHVKAIAAGGWHSIAAL